MVNKILIRTSDRKTLHKDRRTLGMNGENLQEVLLFCLDEKIEGTGIVEVELPNGEKGMIEVERTEEGYELPVKSSLLSKTGFVKFQLRILHDNEEIFKSEIIPLEVKDSINATETIPEQYPTWIDNLTTLKQELEKAESERASNENERISAEKTRQENFTEMQKTVENATSNIKDLKEDYNENAKQKTEEFNKNFEEKQKAINDNAEAKTTAFGENAEAQTKTFNTNTDDKLAEYNKNHTAKMKEFDDNYDTKTKTFDDNAAAKLDEYNKNDKTKTDAYNNNASNKEETFNTNAADKQNEFDENASDKLAEYNQNAKELINKVEQVQAENETLKAENKLIKEQIPSASASENSVHIEDSGTLDFNWKINGGHAQAITTQPENYIDDREAREKTILEATSLYLPIMNLKAGNGYYFKIFDNNNKIQNDSRYLAVDFYDENKVKIKSGPLGFPHNFTEEVATKLKYAKIYYNGNDTDKVIGNTVIKKIGLKITSSVSADDIDMFVPDSPSLDYPSVIETTGSNVNLLENKAITQTTNSVAFTVNKDGSIMANGIATTNTTFKINNDIVPKNISNLILSGCPNNGSTDTYDLKIELYKNGVWTKALYDFGNGVNTGDLSEYTSCKISVTIRKDYNANNLIFKPKLEKDSIVTPYSPYNQGSVEIDVINSNLLDFNVAQDSRVTVNEDGTLTINGTGGFGLNIDKLQLKAGITYYQKVELISGSISGSNINNTFLSFAGAGAWISSENFSQTNLTKDTEKTTIWINATAIFNNAVIKIWANIDKSDFVKQQSQTAIMPIQQEMLKGDYISDKEYHTWGKMILTGGENIGTDGIFQGITQFSLFVKSQYVYDNIVRALSNYFNGVGFIDSWKIDNSIATSANGKIRFMTSQYATVDEFKSYIKSKYDEGSPVIIYYKLAEPLNLELTAEQKAIRDTKLYTYKNITNIAVSDELASIDVDYKKDPTTEHDDLQNQIDEIKQLISTTQTSALLLDNLQKDVETEVE